MNKSLETTAKEIKRDVREEMITDDYTGPLHIEDKYKREGYHRHIADGSKGGWIQQLIKMGYSIVQDETKIGSDTAKTAHSIDSAVRVFMNSHDKEPMGILMEIPEERYQLRKRREQEDAANQLKSVSKTGISTQVGEVLIGNDTFK